MTETRSKKKTASNKGGKEKDVSDLPKALMSKSPEVRKQAMECLCQDVALLESPELIERVTNSLDHSDPEIRVMAARTIAKHMIRVQEVRYEEAEEGEEIEEFDEHLMDQISPLLEDEDPKVRREMAEIFYDLVLEGIVDSDSIYRLGWLLDGQDEETTELALRALEVLSTYEFVYDDWFKEALEPVLELIRYDDGPHLLQAMKILGNLAWFSDLAHKWKAPRYIELLEHKDQKVVQYAAYILGTIGPKKEGVLEALVARLKPEIEECTRALVWAHYWLARGGHWSDESVKPLLELSVNDQDPKVQGHAIKALAYMFCHGCKIDRSEMAKRWAIFQKIREEYMEFDFIQEDESDREADCWLPDDW